eukprot:1294133-Amphidinium_carterae.2
MLPRDCFTVFQDNRKGRSGKPDCHMTIPAGEVHGCSRDATAVAGTHRHVQENFGGAGHVAEGLGGQGYTRLSFASA